jgi:hypothetical protein
MALFARYSPVRSPVEAEQIQRPYDSMPRFWGGPGNGEDCDACNTPITHAQLVMEGIASTFTVKKPIQFHVRCFYVWDVERRKDEA